ncbi:hypothetical protein SLE2022_046650 [Rubroshorea leprosula]
MGLSSFPTAAEGVLPVLVMNTVLSVALLKNMLRSLLQVVGATGNSNLEEDEDGCPQENARERRISITRFKSVCGDDNGGSGDGGGVVVGGGGGGSGSGEWMECCVCLCRFEAEEEVSELSCKHFFHKNCLEKWFDGKNSSCPLCRSIH